VALVNKVKADDRYRYTAAVARHVNVP